VQQDEEELQILRECWKRVDKECASTSNSEMVEWLRFDMEGWMAEVSDLSRRNDELMTSKDSDPTVIHNCDARLEEYRQV